MKKKSIVILAFMVILAVALNYVAFFGLGILGVNYDGVFDEDKGIKKGIDLAGGSVITFEAEAENPTDEQMAVVETIFSSRMANAGYTEARISRGEGGQVTVEIPSLFDTDSAAELLGSTAQLSFVNANGEPVLDGATDIKNAEYKYGPVDEYGASVAHVQITLNKEGVSKFAEATRAAAAAGEGNNYISIKMDDQIISSPRVSEEINSETCIISGDFTQLILF